jgi:hypothetical protein
VRLGIEVMDADLQGVVQDEQRRRQPPRQPAPAVSRVVSPDVQEQPRPHIVDLLQGTTPQQIEAETRAREQRVAAILARAGAGDTKAEIDPSGMRSVDVALTAWWQAQTGAEKTRAVQDWMRGMERIEQQGGDVAAANAHSRKALGGRYVGFMREVGGLARQRPRNDRDMERS